MNNEAIKAIQKASKEKENNFKKMIKWWKKNDYKVLRVIFFPLWGYIVAKEKINNKLNARHEWSEERAKEILNYYVPRKSEWVTDEGSDKYFYFFDNGCSFLYQKNKIKFKDRRFFRLYKHEIRHFLIDNFELEGFTKEIGDCEGTWTEIIFYLNGDNDEC